MTDSDKGHDFRGRDSRGEDEQPPVRVTDKRRLDPESGEVRSGASGTTVGGGGQRWGRRWGSALRRRPLRRTRSTRNSSS